MKEDVLITSISRSNNRSPWKVSVRTNDNGYTFFYVGEGGRVASGPRFNLFLSQIKEKVKRYPVDISFYHIKENRDIKITMINNEISYIDCSMKNLRIIPNASITYGEEIMDNPIHVKFRKESFNESYEENDEDLIFRTLEEMDSVLPSHIRYVVIGEVVSVIDGDTIKIKIRTKPNGVTKLKQNQEIVVRLNGIDAPELKTNDAPNSSKDAKNSGFAKAYGVSLKDIEKVGREAHTKLGNIVGKTNSNRPLVAIHFDRISDGKAPAKDQYGRYIADVYAGKDMRNPDTFLSRLQEGKEFIHVNKTMLTTKSTSSSHIPLAIYEIKYSAAASNVLNTAGWGPELGITPIELSKKDDLKDIVENIDKLEGADKLEKPNSSIKDGNVKFSTSDLIKPNTHDFFPGYDDREKEFFGDIKTIEDMRTHSKLRIGDVMLVIPPTSIQINKTSSVTKVKTLRTKSSVMVNQGQSLTTIDLELYFHDLESINGRKIPMKKGSKKGFYVDGLRPLLAQFSKAPFLPIDNYFINEVVGVHDVALMNLSITTVPNFPESIVATLTLIEFNSESFLMEGDSLGDKINYPMLRWFYNTSLVDGGRGPKYRHFKKIEGPLSSKLTFSIANENQLMQRKESIEWLKSADSPEKLRVDLKEKNVEYASKLADHAKVSKALKQRSAYYSATANQKEHMLIISNSETSDPGLEQNLIKKYGVKKDQAENAVNAGKELFLQIYGSEYNGLNMKTDDGFFLPYESKPFYSVRFGTGLYYGSGLGTEYVHLKYDKAPYKGHEKLGLIVLTEMTDNNNKKALDAVASQYFDEKDKRYYLPPTKEITNVLWEIERQAKLMEDAIDEYEDVFNHHIRVIDASEQGIQMNPYEINGTCIPISIVGRFSNEFSSAHLVAGEAPALQFLGGGDPYLDIVLELDDIAAQDFTNLISLSDQYAKIYNQGITNGYIGIQNQLANLLGIEHLVLENIQINTVQGFPGRYQAFIQAVGFDKTQRQREELSGIPNNHKGIKLDDLANGRYDLVNDRMLEARMNHLEVYPDLELPTYEQLNAALPSIDAKCKEYPNRSSSLYVDPDFYVSTGETLRGMIEKNYNKSHQMNMFDPVGIAAYSSSGDTSKVVNSTDEDLNALDEIGKTEGVEPLDWVYSWGDGDSSGGDTNSSEEEEKDFQNAEVKKFFTGEDGEDPAYLKFPSKKEWNRLFPSGYFYNNFSANKGGDETTVYYAISNLVDKHFGSLYKERNLIRELAGSIDSKGQTKEARLSYMDPDALAHYSFQGSYNDAVTNTYEGTEASKNLKKGVRSKEIKKPDKPSGKSVKNKTAIHPTKERLMTIIKATLDGVSGWKQYNGDAPLLTKSGRIGIGQVDVTGEHMSLDEAKRLTYNWEYNLDVMIGQLASYYKGHRKLKDDASNFIPYSRPWDAMLASYGNPDGSFETAEEIKESPFYVAMSSRFSKYAYKPYNTISGFNPQIYKSYGGVKKVDLIMIDGGNKNTLIDELISMEYYNLKNLESNGLTVKSDRSEINKVTRKFLDSKSEQEVRGIFDRHLEKLSKFGTTYTGEYAVIDTTDKNGYKFDMKSVNKAREFKAAGIRYEDTASSSLESSDLKLYNDVDPHTLYEEMYHDLRRYDQRGRLIRAFPGFQMFIIHEGEYFGRYKFWDNMYGFNAISSIDVYRSRKIAADTAVIEMTNVYSNLTTRRTDVDYADREIKWWENAIWDKPPEELVGKKANEFHKNIFLEPGARIHLRMGYSANVKELPVVFNGTIAEVNTDDIVQIVAQGDGVELGNVISGDPDDDNSNGIFKATEPRDLICKLLSSKGSWVKDFMNDVTDGALFANNPLGIDHFGLPFDVKDTSASKPLGNLVWFNDEYGEVAQNIYSANGSPTYSQWVHPNGDRNWLFSSHTWNDLSGNVTKMLNPGDEKNVIIKMYNKTVWDIVQIVAYTSPDYIAAVSPFEFRSTLFFGKPYWRCVFEYDSEYIYDEAAGTWERHLLAEARRPYMQHKYYNSHQDIIKNDIKASDDGMFTNVIVNYDGKQTPVFYADVDIRYDKQRTQVVEADLVATMADYYTSEVVAGYYGMSALRDNLKDMYKGSLTVMGDPSAKPHDMMFVADDVNDMVGPALIKAVTHHFSIETGFITSIEPDLLVVNDDQVMLDVGKWQSSFFAMLTGGVVGTYLGKKGVRFLGKWIKKIGSIAPKAGQWLVSRGTLTTLNRFNDGDLTKPISTLQRMINGGENVDFEKLSKQLSKELKESSDAIKEPSKGNKSERRKALRKKSTLYGLSSAIKGWSDGKDYIKNTNKVTKGLISVTRGATSATGIGFVVNIGIWIGTEMLFEKYKRFKESLQTVIAIPLTYRGKEFVAGINNHAGMIYGDPPGKIKLMFDGSEPEGEKSNVFVRAMINTANFFSGSGGRYSSEDMEQVIIDEFYDNVGAYADKEKMEKLTKLGGAK